MACHVQREEKGAHYVFYTPPFYASWSFEPCGSSSVWYLDCSLSIKEMPEIGSRPLSIWYTVLLPHRNLWYAHQSFLFLHFPGVTLYDWKPVSGQCAAKCCDGAGGPIVMEGKCKNETRKCTWVRAKKIQEDCVSVCSKQQDCSKGRSKLCSDWLITRAFSCNSNILVKRQWQVGMDYHRSRFLSNFLNFPLYFILCNNIDHLSFYLFIYLSYLPTAII